ncbi:metallophosphoesterase [Paracoccus alkanivorans]|uniref:Phosphodiesterase n=1 Tax=Paracoccus alkanivorans TaxID=2116655 RepID=A0A3M0LYE9_9RHOB|nr:metallophosphoesterase [Paracoccus alkanivorans]RMC30195.1 phosphodiesterase [Paracoccus alkanivorans]
MEHPPITFIHLTDLHVNAPGTEDDMLFNDTSATLERSLNEIRRMSEKPAFIIASGDLTNHGEPEAYRTVSKILAKADLDIPVFFALGNHDRRDGFSAAFPELHRDPSTPYDHDHVICGLHVILLDSSIPGEIGGAWEPGQIDWLKARLADHPELPKLLVMHHAPMIDTQDTEMEWESLSRLATDELRQTIAGANVVGILSGHIHLDRVSHWHGVPVIIGMGHHAATDAVALPDEFNMLDATGFALCALRPSGLTVTYVAHPQSRALRHQLDMQKILAYVAAHKAAAE